MSDREQLLHLVDRARRRVLLPEEGEQLAELVAELEKSAAINAEVDAKMDEQLTGCAEVAQYYKALAERTQAWGEQHRDRANRYRTRTEAVTAECHALNSETRGLNPFAMAGRRDAVARIRAALQTISHDTPVPDDPRVTALEAENARLHAAWHSARLRAQREASHSRVCRMSRAGWKRRAEQIETTIARALSPEGIRAAAAVISTETTTLHVEQIADAAIRAALDGLPTT